MSLTRKNLIKILSAFALLVTINACSYREPIATGVVPEQPIISREDFDYGRQVLAQLSSQYPLSKNDALIDRVQHVVDKLIDAVPGKKEPWNVYVFDAPDVKNAAATQGNHIFVWSGMLDHASNDAELSTVLAHEIGHVLAGHVRPSPAEMIAQTSSQLGSSIAGGLTSAYAGYGAGQVASILTQVLLDAALVNPESQRQELEADHIGLFLLADAGYNPVAAVRFWEKARDDPNFSGLDTVAFLSTHPSSSERYELLEKILPQAENRFLGITPERVTTRYKKKKPIQAVPQEY